MCSAVVQFLVQPILCVFDLIKPGGIADFAIDGLCFALIFAMW